MPQALRIFLESKEAFKVSGGGHLYLVLRTVEVDSNGAILSNNYDLAKDRQIGGTSDTVTANLRTGERLLAQSDDYYKDGVTPSDRHSEDITAKLNVQNLTGGNDDAVRAVWDALASTVSKLNDMYVYELPFVQLFDHLANSNAVIDRPKTTIDAGTSMGGDGDILDFSTLSTGIRITQHDDGTLGATQNNLFAALLTASVHYANFEKVILTSQDDSVKVSGTGMTIDLGGGNDRLESSGPGTIVYTGDGEALISGFGLQVSRFVHEGLHDQPMEHGESGPVTIFRTSHAKSVGLFGARFIK